MDEGSTQRKQKLVEQETPAVEELNLVEFPLALLAKSPPKDQTEVVFEDSIQDSATGEGHRRRVIIRAPQQYGLPTAKDHDVLLAAMVLTQRKNQFEGETVEFSLYELLKLLGLPDNGREYRRLVLSLDRWGSTWIKFDRAWRKKDRWTVEAFSILQHYKLSLGRESDPAEPQTFSWAKVVQESIRDSYTKPFDWDFYRSLRLPSSKRLYRFLDKRFWNRRSYDAPLSPFCVNKLGMAEYRRPDQYQFRLWPAIEELMERKFLRSADKQNVFVKEGPKLYRVRFQKFSGRNRERAGIRRVPELSPLEAELVDRGVTAAVASRVIACAARGEDSVREKLEVFDWYASIGEKKTAGWLRKAIEDDYSTPSGFKGAAQRAQEAATAKEKEAKALRQAEAEKRREAREGAEMAAREAAWQNLGTEEKQTIKERARDRAGNLRLAEGSSLLHSCCLEELPKPSEEEIASALASKLEKQMGRNAAETLT